MKVKVAKWGNSLAVRLPRVVADDLGLAPGREVDLVQDGTRLTLETAPKPKIPVYRLQDLLAQIKPGQKPPPFEDWGILTTEWPADDWSDVAPTDAEWEAWKKEAALRQRAGRKRARSSRRRT
jgi:antitoxin MazE